MRYLKYIVLFLLLSSVYSIGQTEYNWRVVSAPSGVTATGNDGFVNVGSAGTSYAALSWTLSGSLAACTVQVDYSNDGSTVAGQVVAAQTCTSNGSFISVSTSTPSYIRVSYIIGSGGGVLSYVARGCKNNNCLSGAGATISPGLPGQPARYSSTSNIGPVVGIYYVTDQAGATADVQLAACLALISTGGICDARDYGATTQTIAATVNIGPLATNTKQTVLFSPATIFIPSTSTTQMFNLGPRANVDGLTIDTSSQATYSVPAIIIAGYQSSTFGIIAPRLTNSKVNGGANWTPGSVCLELTTPSASASTYYATVDGFNCDNLFDGVLLFAPNTSTGGVNANKLSNMHINGSVNMIDLNGQSAFAQPAQQMSGNTFTNVTSEWNSSNTLCGIKIQNNAYGNSFLGMMLFDAPTEVCLSGTSGGTSGNGVTSNFIEGFISSVSDTSTGFPNGPNQYFCPNCVQGQSNLGALSALWLGISGKKQNNLYTTTGGYVTCCIGGLATEEFISAPGIGGSGTGWHWYAADNSTGALGSSLMTLGGTGQLTVTNGLFFPGVSGSATTITALTTNASLFFTPNGTGKAVVGAAGVQAPAYFSTTNCSSSASPAVCGSAAAGSVAVPTGTNPTLVVNTTAVTANSQIFVQSDDTLGTKLGITCNSTIASLAVEPVISARTGGTSFTITINGVISTNAVCLSYFIVN